MQIEKLQICFFDQHSVCKTVSVPKHKEGFCNFDIHEIYTFYKTKKNK